jgi:hypothetical protein
VFSICLVLHTLNQIIVNKFEILFGKWSLLNNLSNGSQTGRLEDDRQVFVYWTNKKCCSARSKSIEWHLLQHHTWESHSRFGWFFLGMVASRWWFWSNINNLPEHFYWQDNHSGMMQTLNGGQFIEWSSAPLFIDICMLYFQGGRGQTALCIGCCINIHYFNSYNK